MALLKNGTAVTFDAVVREMERRAGERDALSRYLRLIGLCLLVRELGPYAVEDAIAIAFEHDERHARRVRSQIAEAATELGVAYEPELQKRRNRSRGRADRPELFMLGSPCDDARHVNNLGSTLRFRSDGRCIECGRPPSGAADTPRDSRPQIPEPYQEHPT